MSLILQSCFFDQTGCQCPANGSIVLWFKEYYIKQNHQSFKWYARRNYPTSNEKGHILCRLYFYWGRCLKGKILSVVWSLVCLFVSLSHFTHVFVLSTLYFTYHMHILYKRPPFSGLKFPRPDPFQCCGTRTYTERGGGCWSKILVLIPKRFYFSDCVVWNNGRKLILSVRSIREHHIMSTLGRRWSHVFDLCDSLWINTVKIKLRCPR